jgi:hypothetical protein
MEPTHPAFVVHMLNAAGRLKAQKIAHVFSDLLRELERQYDLSADPRLKAIVTTKLEEACFFAKKAMASQPGNTETA